MKKIFIFLTSITTAFIFLLPVKADAKAEANKTITFKSAIHGITDEGNELTIVLYKKGSLNMAYFNDTFSKGYAPYTVQTKKSPESDEYTRMIIGDSVMLSYFENENRIVTDAGVTYLTDILEESDVKELMY